MPIVEKFPIVEQHEEEGLPVWVSVLPLHFGISDLLTVAALLPEGAVVSDMEIDGDRVYTRWIR